MVQCNLGTWRQAAYYEWKCYWGQGTEKTVSRKCESHVLQKKDWVKGGGIKGVNQSTYQPGLLHPQVWLTKSPKYLHYFSQILTALNMLLKELTICITLANLFPVSLYSSLDKWFLLIPRNSNMRENSDGQEEKAPQKEHSTVQPGDHPTHPARQSVPARG